MPIPTKGALMKHPRAVIVMSADVKDPEIVTHDFEWFDTEAAASTYFAETCEWCKEDVRINGDFFHLVAYVADTTIPMKVEGLKVFDVPNATDTEFAKNWGRDVGADSTRLIAETAAERHRREDANAPKVEVAKTKPKVKARKPSAAGAAFKGEAVVEAEDKPKRAVRKPTSKPVESKAAALKARLAEKRAVEPTPESEATTPVPPMALYSIPGAGRAARMRGKVKQR